MYVNYGRISTERLFWMIRNVHALSFYSVINFARGSTCVYVGYLRQKVAYILLYLNMEIHTIRHSGLAVKVKQTTQFLSNL